MCCPVINSQVNKGNRAAVRRLALVLCILFIATTALSFAFIITHANHAHDHNGPDGACTTCIAVQSAGNLLKQIAISAVAVAAVLGGLFTLLYCLKLSYLLRKLNTLISLKVQLNN